MSPELVPLDGIREALDGLKGSLAAEDARSMGLALGAALDIRGTQERLGYEPGFASASIPDDAYDAMSHQQIYAGAQTLDPAGITGVADNWRALGYSAAEDTAAFAEELGDIIGNQWQGPAADAAGQGVVRYANAALRLALASDAFADKVAQSYGGVSGTKASIPPPESDSFIASTVDVLSSVTFGAIKSREFEREEAEERARMVMKTVYAPAIRQAAEQIPILPPALNPLTGSDGSTSGGFGAPGTLIGAEPYRSPMAVGGRPAESTTNPVDAAGTPTTGGNPAGPHATGSSDDAATRATGWTPAEASAPSTAPGGASSPATSGSTSAGGPGTGSIIGAAPSGSSGARYQNGRGAPGSLGGGSGSSGLAGGSGNNGMGGRSGSTLGAPGGGLLGGGPGGAAGTGGSGAGAGGSAAGRPGSPGMGGMGMAPAAGRGGPGGDDDVHETPGYLIDAVNGDELIGTLPLVAPPVLGA